ncbi:MAG: maleylpyruvate isomerase N-terminal domain-containing protein [Actinomycetota bacterium]
MSLPVYDKTVGLAAVRAAARRFAGALREVHDPGRPAIGQWSIGEVAAHTTHIYDLFPRLIEGQLSPVTDLATMDRTWQELLGEDGERDPGALAGRIETAAERFVAAAEGAEWTSAVPWHGNTRVPVYSLVGILLTEAELHGRDVARAETRPWTIPRSHAVMGIEGLLPLLHHFVDPAGAVFDAVYELRVRGGSVVYVKVDDGRVDLDEEPQRRVDCRLSVDPVEYLLVGFGRKSRVGPMVTGKLVAWGRKPWLGLRFAGVFRTV